MNLTSGVSYKVKSNNDDIFITPFIDVNYNNYIMIYPNMYDTGFAKIYHDNHNNTDIIMMIGDKVIEVAL
jgi:hypothetical protein